MVNIAPLDYERYAVLVSPLLVPGAVPAKPPSAVDGLESVIKTAGTSFQKYGDQDLNKPRSSVNLGDENKTQFRLKSIPAKHPDPATGRGQNIDIFV